MKLNNAKQLWRKTSYNTETLWKIFFRKGQTVHIKKSSVNTLPYTLRTLTFQDFLSLNTALFHTLYISSWFSKDCLLITFKHVDIASLLTTWLIVTLNKHPLNKALRSEWEEDSGSMSQYGLCKTMTWGEPYLDLASAAFPLPCCPRIKSTGSLKQNNK